MNFTSEGVWKSWIQRQFFGRTDGFGGRNSPNGLVRRQPGRELFGVKLPPSGTGEVAVHRSVTCQGAMSLHYTRWGEASPGAGETDRLHSSPSDSVVLAGVGGSGTSALSAAAAVSTTRSTRPAATSSSSASSTSIPA